MGCLIMLFLINKFKIKIKLLCCCGMFSSCSWLLCVVFPVSFAICGFCLLVGWCVVACGCWIVMIACSCWCGFVWLWYFCGFVVT